MCINDKARNVLGLNKKRKLCVRVEVEKWHLGICGSRLGLGGLYKALPGSIWME